MIELNKIYCESNLDTLSRMPDEFIDLTVTSPPYEQARVYKGYSFVLDMTVAELYRVTKPGAMVVWVIADVTKNGGESGNSFRQALLFMDAGFKLTDTMIFAKNNPIPGDCGPRYRQTFEYMFAFCKGTPKTFNPLTVPTSYGTTPIEYFRVEKEGRKKYFRAGSHVKLERRHDNIFHYNVGGGSNNGGEHPAVFPEQLATDQIKSWSNPGDLVYDCFMGSGTTAKAAHQLGRNWIGSEISQEYVDLANKRLEPYLAQSNLFEQKQ
jgi:DNA modification methylase